MRGSSLSSNPARPSASTWPTTPTAPPPFAARGGSGGIDVLVNNHPAGNTATLPDTGVVHRNGISGYWFEREVSFDAKLLHSGTNTIQLRPDAKSWVDGVPYDYLRSELDES